MILQGKLSNVKGSILLSTTNNNGEIERENIFKNSIDSWIGVHFNQSNSIKNLDLSDCTLPLVFLKDK